jgi:hypothetical protein
LYRQQAVTGKNFYAAADVSLPGGSHGISGGVRPPQLFSEELRTAFRTLR